MQKNIATLSLIILIATPLQGMDMAYRMLTSVFSSNPSDQEKQRNASTKPASQTAQAKDVSQSGSKSNDNATTASDGDLIDLFVGALD
jgi:hypothetical protein